MQGDMQQTVLVIDDEGDVVNLLRYNLNRAGFKVLIARDGEEGLESARKNLPDVIVLDLMMPKMTGEEVCRALRDDDATRHLAIVMLTAKIESDERIAGLELGADDYVVKPFSPRELVLRVEALLRRIQTPNRSDILEVDHFVVDRNAFEIRLDDRKLDLTTTEFKLLALLIERRGKVQSRDELLYDVWGYKNAIDTRTVDTHMRRLREKLREHSPRLETVRGEGYRFNPLPVLA